MDRFSVSDFIKKKAEGKKITLLTAYDYPFARILDEAGIDAILVGDSLAMVVQGKENTLPVTMDEMLYHTSMVLRATKRAMVIGDMPYMSYQSGIRDAILNGGRFIKEAGAQAVKLEGGLEIIDQIRAMTRAEIPVMAHIGIRPQAVYKTGGYKVQGRDKETSERLIEEACAVEEAGAFSLLLEGIPMDLAKRITSELNIPTIGIGAGPYCDGQILVLHDLLGLFRRFVPKFVKQYANLEEEILSAVKAYKKDVEDGVFPTLEHSFT